MNRLPPTTFEPCKPAGKSKAPWYIQWVKSQKCIICGHYGVQAHHEPPKGMGGGRSTDYEVVPLCETHHRMRHSQTSRAEIESDYSMPLFRPNLREGHVKYSVEWIKSQDEQAVREQLVRYIRIIEDN